MLILSSLFLGRRQKSHKCQQISKIHATRRSLTLIGILACAATGGNKCAPGRPWGNQFGINKLFRNAGYIEAPRENVKAFRELITMCMIDPKGSRQELEAIAIIRAHRAQNQPPEASALAARPPQLIVLPIPGFWKSHAHQIPTVSPENNVRGHPPTLGKARVRH